MAHGKNRRANKPYGLRTNPPKKSGPRRITGEIDVENNELGQGWYYRIARWDLSDGSSEYHLEVYHTNQVGVQLGGWSRFYGQLDHAQKGIAELFEEAVTEERNSHRTTPG